MVWGLVLSCPLCQSGSVVCVLLVCVCAPVFGLGTPSFFRGGGGSFRKARSNATAVSRLDCG